MAKVFTQAGVARLRSSTKRRVIRDGASTALFLVIQPSGHKSWMMRFRYGDGASKIFLGPLDQSGRRHDGELVVGQPLSLIAARQLASRVNADRASGIDVIAAHRARKHRQRVAVAEAAVHSFAAAARAFIVEHARPKTRGSKATATILGLDEDLKPRPGGIAHRWADRDVRTVTAADLHVVIEEGRRIGTPGIVARNDKPSEARARKVHAALSQLFGWLLRHRRIEVNPMATLHPPAAGPSRDRVLTTTEIKSFWAGTAALTEPSRSILRLLLITGCRLNEVARMRWEEVAADGLSVTVAGARSKNHRPFIVFLPPLARQLIAALDRNGEFVFTTNGIAPVAGWSKTKAKLDAIMAAAAWTIHDLRRTAATGLAEIGVQPHIIEAVLNHASGFRSGVAGTYNRFGYAAEKKQALEQWAAHVESIVGGTNIVAIRGGRA